MKKLYKNRKDGDIFELPPEPSSSSSKAIASTAGGMACVRTCVCVCTCVVHVYLRRGGFWASAHGCVCTQPRRRIYAHKLTPHAPPFVCAGPSSSSREQKKAEEEDEDAEAQLSEDLRKYVSQSVDVTKVDITSDDFKSLPLELQHEVYKCVCVYVRACVYVCVCVCARAKVRNRPAPSPPPPSTLCVREYYIRMHCLPRSPTRSQPIPCSTYKETTRIFARTHPHTNPNPSPHFLRSRSCVQLCARTFPDPHGDSGAAEAVVAIRGCPQARQEVHELAGLHSDPAGETRMPHSLPLSLPPTYPLIQPSPNSHSTSSARTLPFASVRVHIQILMEMQERQKRWSRFEDVRKHVKKSTSSLDFTQMQLERLMKKNEIQRRLDDVRSMVSRGLFPSFCLIV